MADGPAPAVKTFHVPIGAQDAEGDSSSDATLAIRIVEPARVKSDNLPLTTWASSLILARALHKLGLERHLRAASSSSSSSSAAPIPILELGAGTGLVGLSAAALLQVRGGSGGGGGGGGDIIGAALTDLAGIVPGVAANIRVNAALLAARGCGHVRAGTLDWQDASRIVFHRHRDEKIDGKKTGMQEEEEEEEGETMAVLPAQTQATLLFAADTIYDDAHPALLESVVVRWMERAARARFVVCYPLRVAYLDQIRELWARLEAAGLECELEGRDTGEVTNGDDEMLCEYVVWKWREGILFG